MTLRPAPKPHRALVSKAIRQSARGRTCALRWVPCAPDDTVVLAHVRGIWAGVAQKPSDIFGVFACQHCHDSMDGRRGPKPPASEVLRAMIETQTILLAEGIITVKGAA